MRGCGAKIKGVMTGEMRYNNGSITIKGEADGYHHRFG